MARLVVSTSVMWSTAAPDKATTTRQMTSVNTVTTSVPAAPVSAGEASPGRRTPRWPWRLLVGTVLLTFCFLGATLVEIPYYALAPGSAVEVGELVVVAEQPPASSEGDIYLLTVSLSRVTLVGALRGWIDPEVAIVADRRIVPPDADEEELAAVNLAQMDASKQQALGVAFEALGYDAISGRGAEVVEVTAGTPAGMSLAPGDVIVGVDGAPVTSHHDVVDLLAGRRPGTEVRVTVDPVGPTGPQSSTLTLDAAPGQPDLAFLGATLATLDPRFDFPIPIEIAVEEIGGPSAGLAFTLEVLDVLTAGDLTGGQRVAATGTIGLDGSVGEVGGVAQKTAAAKREGVGLLLVPAAELEQARRLADGGLTVEAVDNLSQALGVLADHGGDPLSPHF